jgi:hypothetical protein
MTDIMLSILIGILCIPFMIILIGVLIVFASILFIVVMFILSYLYIFYIIKNKTCKGFIDSLDKKEDATN